MRFVKRQWRRQGAIAMVGALTIGFVLALSAVGLSGCGGNAEASVEAAPDFMGVTLGGERVTLSEYRGKPLVLAFMASW